MSLLEDWRDMVDMVERLAVLLRELDADGVLFNAYDIDLKSTAPLDALLAEIAGLLPDVVPDVGPCEDCHGTKSFEGELCAACRGTGVQNDGWKAAGDAT